MACNRDEGCYNIYTNIYPNAQESIDGSIGNIKSEITEISTTLGELVIPEDYLGEKVKRKVEEIQTFLEKDLSDLDTEKTAIDGFIEKQIAIHKKHYDDKMYEIAQAKAKMAKAKEETDLEKNRKVDIQEKEF